MNITFISLCKDSYNFIKNQLVAVFFLLITLALITVFLSHISQPYISNILKLVASVIDVNGQVSTQMLDTMSEIQKEQLVSALFSNVSKLTLFSLLDFLLFLSLSLSLISLRAKNIKVNLVNTIKYAVPLLPHLALFIILIFSIITVLSSFLFSILGIYVAIGINLLIITALILTPIIITAERTNALSAMKQSIKLGFTYTLPIVLLWGCFKMLTLSLYLNINTANSASLLLSLIISMINDLFALFMLAYLYRFYMLIKSDK